MDDWKRGTVVGTLVATVVWCVAMSVAYHCSVSSFVRQAIEHGAARYHPTTGEFEWIDRAEGEQQ